MFTLAKQIAAASASIMPLFIAGAFYYIFNFIVLMDNGIYRKENALLNRWSSMSSTSLLEMKHDKKDIWKSRSVKGYINRS